MPVDSGKQTRLLPSIIIINPYFLYLALWQRMSLSLSRCDIAEVDLQLSLENKNRK